MEGKVGNGKGRRSRGPTSKGLGIERGNEGQERREAGERRQKVGRGGSCPANKKSFPHACT